MLKSCERGGEERGNGVPVSAGRGREHQGFGGGGAPGPLRLLPVRQSSPPGKRGAPPRAGQSARAAGLRRRSGRHMASASRRRGPGRHPRPGGRATAGVAGRGGGGMPQSPTRRGCRPKTPKVVQNPCAVAIGHASFQPLLPTSRSYSYSVTSFYGAISTPRSAPSTSRRSSCHG